MLESIQYSECEADKAAKGLSILMAISLETVNRAEDEILNVLGEQNAPLSARELTDVVHRRGVDDSSIVSAIWFLIDSNKIRMTPDLKLETVNKR